MCFAIFPLHVSKAPRLPLKSDAKSYKALHMSRKILFANLMLSCSKMQPFLGNQRPDLLTSLMNMSLALRLPREIQILFKCPTPAIVFGNATKPSRFAHSWQGAEPFAPTTQNHASTSKSGANMRCFWHSDFEMCFAPQRRALFQHPNFQKWSETVSFKHFWLRNVLHAKTACTFSASTSKCASRHNGVQFFIPHLARWLCTRRFSEPTFRPSGAANH